VHMRKLAKVQQLVKHVLVEGYNCSKGLTSTEEDKIMKANPTLVPLFKVQVDQISEKYMLDHKVYQDQARIEVIQSMEEDEGHELCLWESKMPRRVLEDQLET